LYQFGIVWLGSGEKFVFFDVWAFLAVVPVEIWAFLWKVFLRSNSRFCVALVMVAG
jgi:hypothetical protein